jgi:hypothetical protein
LHMHGIFDRLGVRSRTILAASWRPEIRDGQITNRRPAPRTQTSGGD